jgi:hypothetical protein
MEKFTRLTLSLVAAATIAIAPSMAETRGRSTGDKGVQEAIAYQRAKDRADAAQARKEARHPEQFTYAAPQKNDSNGAATQQRKEALEHSAKQGER